MNNIGITQILHMSYSNIDRYDFEYRDIRLIDQYTKVSLINTKRLYDMVGGEAIDSERAGLVFATDTGPYNSIMEVHGKIARSGYIGINPSKYPNIMLSTPLSRIAAFLQLKGPTISLYVNGRIDQAFQYAYIQILSKRCDSVFITYTNENKSCFSMLVEKEEAARIRGINMRFLLGDKQEKDKVGDRL